MMIKLIKLKWLKKNIEKSENKIILTMKKIIQRDNKYSML